MEITGAKVYVRNDDVNGALRRLKKILEADNRQKDLSKKEYFVKKSIQRKRAKDQAKKRSKKQGEKDLAQLALKQSGVSWMKSKRKRRKVLDKKSMFDAEVKKINKSKK